MSYGLLKKKRAKICEVNWSSCKKPCAGHLSSQLDYYTKLSVPHPGVLLYSQFRCIALVGMIGKYFFYSKTDKDTSHKVEGCIQIHLLMKITIEDGIFVVALAAVRDLDDLPVAPSTNLRFLWKDGRLILLFVEFYLSVSLPPTKRRLPLFA